jgi:carbamoyl-phosphate synthase / aspartate carbamoyltransferase
MISTKNMSIENINNIFVTALNMKNKKNNNNDIGFNNKILINAFFEPSMRTSLSFESAMNRLGGKVINFNKDIFSLKKNESINDTLKTLENYGDLIVICHPDKNIIHNIVDKNLLSIPVINGGNGAEEHPTQALLDLFTIYEKYNYSFDNIKKLKFLFIGDILDSRTINSLIDLLHVFPTIQINILPFNNETSASNELLKNISKIHNQNINDIIIDSRNINWKDYDVFYVTRYQIERKMIYDQIDDNNNLDSNIIINNYNIQNMKKDAMIMHPFPRNEEINPEVDNNERVYYFKQMNNSVFVRMAIISHLLVHLK